MVLGSVLLRQLIDDNGWTLSSVAGQIGVSQVSVHYWLRGVNRPDAEQREKLHVFTRGVVPRESWRTADEQSAIDAVRPYHNAREPQTVAPHIDDLNGDKK